MSVIIPVTDSWTIEADCADFIVSAYMQFPNFLMFVIIGDLT